MSKMRYLACLTALLVPFATCAQVGVVDHNWCLPTGSGRYGAVQVTYPGPESRNNTYTFLYFGRAEYRIPAPAPLLSAALLVPLATVVLILTRIEPPSLSRAVSDRASR